ncbi:MAG TPA: alpha/beta fold hydrolase [Gemmatimonadaceae bacterium]|nr:alpha/beta fold hydrolase [Gemmatimonadaceae bacterium]
MTRTAHAAALLLALGGTARAQGAETYTFRMLLGRDTLTSEVVQRTGARLDVELVDKTSGARWQYGLTLAPAGAVPAMTSAFYRLAQGDTVPFQTVEIAFAGDSVTATIGGNVSRVERLATSAGALPYINPSFAMIEQVIRRAWAMGGGTDTVPLFMLAGGRTIPAVVERVGGDSVVVRIGPSAIRAAVGADGALLGATIPAQGVHVVRLEGAHPLASRPIDYGAPPGAPYTAQDVTVHTPDGLTLTGTLTLPAARAGRVPAVVTITGSGAEDRDERISIVEGYRPFWQIADTLARRGIATLRLDDRGVNGSSAGPAGATSADFANDVRAALAYLRTRPEIDGARLGLVGHSEGGMIAPMVAATDSALRGIVLLAGPAYTGRRIVAFQQRNGVAHAPGLTAAQRKSALAEAEAATDSMARTNGWMRYFLSYDPLPTARRVRVPVLILQGETDQQVTPEQADTLAAAFRAGGNRDVTVRKFPATDHLFLADSVGDPAGYGALRTRSVRPAVLGAIADWLAARLR